MKLKFWRWKLQKLPESASNPLTPEFQAGGDNLCPRMVISPSWMPIYYQLPPEAKIQAQVFDLRGYPIPPGKVLVDRYWYRA